MIFFGPETTGADGGAGAGVGVAVAGVAVGTKGKFAKAQGTGKWSVTAKVLPGKNLILLVAVDPTTGLKSAVVKVTVTRK